MNLIGKIEQLTKHEWLIKNDGVIFIVYEALNIGVVRKLKEYEKMNRKVNIWIRKDGLLLGVKLV